MYKVQKNRYTKKSARMDGFVAALNPSVGLFECCERREVRSKRSVLSMSRVEDDGMKASTFGVGIGFLQNKSGTLFVSTLTPEGVFD